MSSSLLIFFTFVSLYEIASCYNTTEFFFTGDVQIYIVPDNVTTLGIYACGARGGDAGGYGGCIEGTFDVVGGDELFVYVGGMGQFDNTMQNTHAAGGYNGGGAGNNNGYYTGGGGGGASDVRLDPSELTSRIIVGAGGGGGCSSPSSLPGAGGASTGGSGTSSSSTYTAGSGGTQTAGGAGSSEDGNPGTFGNGGSGGDSTSGGGGGGWYGGGGGGGNAYYCAGGGGSNYAATNSISTNMRGAQAGDGYVSILPDPDPDYDFDDDYNFDISVVWAPIVAVFGSMLLGLSCMYCRKIICKDTNLSEMSENCINPIKELFAADCKEVAKRSIYIICALFLTFNNVATLILMIIYVSILTEYVMPMTWWSYFVSVVFGMGFYGLPWQKKQWATNLLIALFTTAVSTSIAGAVIEGRMYTHLTQLQGLVMNSYDNFDYWGEETSQAKKCWNSMYGYKDVDDTGECYTAGYAEKATAGEYYCIYFFKTDYYHDGRGNFIFNNAANYYLASCIYLCVLTVHHMAYGLWISEILKDEGRALTKNDKTRIGWDIFNNINL